MTADPPKKKTTSRAKKTGHGCKVCMIAVTVATAMPAGVNELFDHARSTKSATAGTAMYGCIFRGLQKVQSMVIARKEPC